jgi:hypothetical protein
MVGKNGLLNTRRHIKEEDQMSYDVRARILDGIRADVRSYIKDGKPMPP